MSRIWYVLALFLSLGALLFVPAQPASAAEAPFFKIEGARLGSGQESGGHLLEEFSSDQVFENEASKIAITCTGVEGLRNSLLVGSAVGEPGTSKIYLWYKGCTVSGNGEGCEIPQGAFFANELKGELAYARDEEPVKKGDKLVDFLEPANSEKAIAQVEFTGSKCKSTSATITGSLNFELLNSQRLPVAAGENEQEEAFGYIKATTGEACKIKASKFTECKKPSVTAFGSAGSYRGEMKLLDTLLGVGYNLGVFTGPMPSSPTKAEVVFPNPGSPAVQSCYVGKSVDCASGNETEQQTDISVGGRGPGLHVVRTYNAQSAASAKVPGPWGYGWTGSYDASLEVGTEIVTVHQDDGSAVGFYKSGTEYTEASWEQARLIKSGENYIFTLPAQVKLEFNSEGRLVKETERSGNSDTLSYNGAHQLEKVTDGAGRTLTFKYNSEGFVESVTDPIKHVVSYTYSSKQLASVTIEGKVRWEYEYSSPHLLSKVTDGRKHSTTIEYNSSHQVVKESRAGHERKWSYGVDETTITEPNGSQTVETFNAAGEPTKVTHAKGTSLETTSEYAYSEAYELIALIDGSKHEWKYGYDGEDNKISETDPNGDERKWTYDKTHDIETETTPEGETTTIKRNSTGKPEVIERPIGSETQKTEYKYDEKGDITEAIDPLGHKTKYAYDAAGDKESETDPEGDERKWKYNEDSQEIEETSPRGFTTKTERDEYGLPTKVEDPLKHTTEYKYDGDQNVESETDGNKHTTTFEYNEENLRTKVIEANKDEVTTEYDSEGQMVARKDGNGHTWHYKRNALEQVAEEENPLKQVTKKTYTKVGALESREDPEKHTTEYKYDESQRLTAIKYSTGKPSEVTFEYNKDGKVAKMKDETGTTENTYDKLDRLTQYKNGAGKVVKYEYNLADEPIKITYPNEKAIIRSYDKDNRLEKVTDWFSRSETFGYNADSQMVSIAYPSESKYEGKFAFNEADQSTELKYTKAGETVFQQIYARDGDGQVTKRTNKGFLDAATTEYKYDEDNRMTEAGGLAYEYDDANDPTKIEGKAPYTYNAADELEKGPEASYAYNADGDRVETKPTSGPVTTYGYDQAGDLTSVKRPEEGETKKIEDSYSYDGEDLREAQTISGTTTHLTWDTAEEGAPPRILSDESNFYVYGPENIAIEQLTSGGAAQWLLHDQQGSMRVIINLKGEIEADYGFTPYGSLSSVTHTNHSLLRYDDEYTSTDNETIYLRSRTYDPGTAQFLSVDPALATTGEPYAYADDNPVNYLDPRGTEDWWNPLTWSGSRWKRVGQTVLIGAAAVGVAATVLPFVGVIAVGGTAAVALGYTASAGAIIGGIIYTGVGVAELQEGKKQEGLESIANGLAAAGVGSVGIGILNNDNLTLAAGIWSVGGAVVFQGLACAE